MGRRRWAIDDWKSAIGGLAAAVWLLRWQPVEEVAADPRVGRGAPIALREPTSDTVVGRYDQFFNGLLEGDGRDCGSLGALASVRIVYIIPPG